MNGVTGIHGNEHTEKAIELDLLAEEVESINRRLSANRTGDGEHLLGNNGQHFDLNTIELIEA